MKTAVLSVIACLLSLSAFATDPCRTKYCLTILDNCGLSFSLYSTSGTWVRTNANFHNGEDGYNFTSGPNIGQWDNQLGCDSGNYTLTIMLNSADHSPCCRTNDATVANLWWWWVPHTNWQGIGIVLPKMTKSTDVKIWDFGGSQSCNIANPYYECPRFIVPCTLPQ